jgi:cell division protein ZapA (FtsZ GTPase activity inhibitor)
MQQLEARLGELQGQIKEWADGRQHGARQRAAQDNEAWANLMGLLASIQERVGTLSQDRASVMAGLQAGALLEELEQEMQNLRGISEEIEMLQWRLRRSLNERESNLSILRTRTSNGA